MASEVKDPNKKVCAICGKPLSPSMGDIGDTCKAHEGKIRIEAKIAEAVPDGFVRMSKVCEAARDQGIPVSAVVNACGGDATTKPPLDEVFRVTYVGRAKWLNPDVMTKGFALLLRHREEKAQAKEAKRASETLDPATIAAMQEEQES